MLVEAKGETEAHKVAEFAHRELFPELIAKTTIRSVTLALAEEIELWRWHQDFLGRERDQQSGNYAGQCDRLISFWVLASR